MEDFNITGSLTHSNFSKESALTDIFTYGIVGTRKIYNWYRLPPFIHFISTYRPQVVF